MKKKKNIGQIYVNKNIWKTRSTRKGGAQWTQLLHDPATKDQRQAAEQDTHISSKSWLQFIRIAILRCKYLRYKYCLKDKNKDQQGKGNVHRTQPRDTPKQGFQKAPNQTREQTQWNKQRAKWVEIHYLYNKKNRAILLLKTVITGWIT
jgi:alpha-galactosidase/6-phospho-beta-glucosidase family protein